MRTSGVLGRVFLLKVLLHSGHIWSVVLRCRPLGQVSPLGGPFRPSQSLTRAPVLCASRSLSRASSLSFGVGPDSGPGGGGRTGRSGQESPPSPGWCLGSPRTYGHRPTRVVTSLLPTVLSGLFRFRVVVGCDGDGRRFRGGPWGTDKSVGTESTGGAKFHVGVHPGLIGGLESENSV